MLRRGFNCGAMSAVACFLHTKSSVADNATVPDQYFERTFLIKISSPNRNIFATGFAIRLQNESYLVTARHVFKSLATPKSNLFVELSSGFTLLDTTHVFLSSSKLVDIAAFRFAEDPRAIKTPDFTSNAIHGFSIGSKVWLLGYLRGHGGHLGRNVDPNSPYAQNLINRTAPLVKNGFISGIDYEQDGAIKIYIDAVNDRGFSGGPALFWDTVENSPKIIGVISGYLPEPLDVGLGPFSDQNFAENIYANGNSGLTVAFASKYIRESVGHPPL